MRIVLLVDMDSFFASVEQAHHPHLRGKPVIVCGDPERRGVVTAASYEARPFGVRAGMPLPEARRLCPHAEYVAGNPDKYVALSLQLLDLYVSFSPDVEPFSVDEAFVGLPRSVRTPAEGRDVARAIQRAIVERFGITASIGVGPNKLIAKMASGEDKPNGLTALDEEAYCRRFWERPVQTLWGVGPRLAERMRSLGIRTVGDLAHAPVPVLAGAFGIIGPQLREAAHGRDDTPLVPYHRGVEPKSMGHEVTLAQDVADPEFVHATLLRLCDQVARRLRGEGYVGRVVAVKLRDSRFRTRIRQRVVAPPIDDHARLYAVARALVGTLWKGEPVRLLGVTAASLARAPAATGELFAAGARERALRVAMDRVRDTLGEAMLVPAGTLMQDRTLGHVPFGALSARVLERRIESNRP